MTHISRPNRFAVVSAVATSTTIGIAASSLALLDVAHAFGAASICVHSSVQSKRCMKIKDTGVHFLNNNCRSDCSCTSTALCAGPNPFVNGPEDGQSEEGNGSSNSFPSPPSPFSFPPSNNGENGDVHSGNSGPSSPNPFLQPKPSINSGSNSPFGSGGSLSSNSFTNSDPSSSPFGANENNEFTSSNTSGGPNPFQQQPQTPAAANPFGGNNISKTQPLANPSFPSRPNNNNVGPGIGSSQSPFGQRPTSTFGDTQVNNSSPFGGGPPSLQTNNNDNNAFGSASPSATQPPNTAPPSADDTWLEFSIHPGHLPDPAFMSTTSTDYSNAIPRGLVLRTVKPGMRFGQTMTQKAEVVVSLGEEPLGQGGNDTEEPEKVWDLGPGEYVVNRGTRLDKTRMYVMDFEPSTTREGGLVLRTINPGIVDEYGNNVRLAEVVVSGGPDGKWREPKPQMEGMEGVVGSSMMDGGGGAMGGVDGGSNRVSRGFVAFSSGSLGPARRGSGGDNAGGGDGYTYGPAPQTGGDPYSLW